MPDTTPLRRVTTNNKGELQFADIAPDVKTDAKMQDLSTTIHLRGTEESGDHRVLLAFDDHSEGLLAYNYALKQLRPGDHLFFVQVLEINKSDVAYLEEEHVLKTMNHVVLENLMTKAEPFVNKGIDVTLHVAHGEPKNALCALADFHKVDQILLGRRKLGRFQKLISAGSVSQYVLQHANQTVTIVKA